MKRLITLFLVAAIVLCYTSCKDDDDNPNSEASPSSTVTIDKAMLENGIVVSKYSNVAELPIDCDGEWSITIDTVTSWLRIEHSQPTASPPGGAPLFMTQIIHRDPMWIWWV